LRADNREEVINMKEKRKTDIPFDPMHRQNVFIPRDFPMDPLGSYTGQPIDPFDQPVQDADDL